MMVFSEKPGHLDFPEKLIGSDHRQQQDRHSWKNFQNLGIKSISCTCCRSNKLTFIIIIMCPVNIWLSIHLGIWRCGSIRSMIFLHVSFLNHPVKFLSIYQCLFFHWFVFGCHEVLLCLYSHNITKGQPDKITGLAGIEKKKKKKTIGDHLLHEIK